MLKYFIIFLCFGAFAKSEQKKGKYLEPTLENLLASLEKLLVFFSNRYDKLNLDGLFGVRAVQGEVQRALEKGEYGIYPEVANNPDLKKKLENILSICEKIVKISLPAVKKKNEHYFSTFISIVDKPFRMFEVKPQKITTFDPDALPKPKKGEPKNEEEEFNEEVSDQCMGSLLGVNGFEKCDVNLCWERMTKLDTSLYYTTHQILWLQLAIESGCQAKLEANMVRGGGLVELFKKLCTSVIFQMESVYKNREVSVIFQDIFLEQGMICGGIGFIDAVNRTWLRTVMKWQHQELGCFREQHGDMGIDIDTVLEPLMVEKRKEWRSRYLLEDADMGDRCSAHKSAVGAGYYATYLRLFLDPEYMRHKLLPDLYKEEYITREMGFPMLKYFMIILAILFVVLLVTRRRFRYKLFSCVKSVSKQKTMKV